MKHFIASLKNKNHGVAKLWSGGLNQVLVLDVQACLLSLVQARQLPLGQLGSVPRPHRAHPANLEVHLQEVGLLQSLLGDLAILRKVTGDPPRKTHRETGP